MFSLSKFNLQLKKNSKICLSDYRINTNFSIFCIFEFSSSSDTGNLYFIQQKFDDGSIKVKKLVWITDSMVSAFSISPTCDWMVLAYRSGLICILPIGFLMGRVQKKVEHWKSNDVTYLQSNPKTGTIVTCMKWWTSYKERNMCIVGRSDGELLIIDLSTGSTLFTEKFPNYIKSIDLLCTQDKKLSYCFITTQIPSQWKLLLEEIHDVADSEFGFDVLEFSNTHSSSIIYSKSSKKSKGSVHTNPSYMPSKLYQFPQSTYLKSQYYSGKYFLGAYDTVSGKYKLFDCENLDSPLYEFQLPLSVIDICVTEDFLFLVLGNSKEFEDSNIRTSIFTELKTLKFCVVCRQYAHSRYLERSHSTSLRNQKDEIDSIKPSVELTVPKSLLKSVFVEFGLPDLFSSDDIISVLNFPVFFNFSHLEKILIDDQYLPPKKSSWLCHTQNLKRDSTNTSLTNEDIYSKWAVNEIKSITPVFIIGSSGISVCYMSQCFEDKCIDYLLSYDMKNAEMLGAGLKLDMNELYRYTAQLLTSGMAQLDDKVTKSKKSLILEYFELASSPIKTVLNYISQYWPIEKCLLYALSQLPNINKMSPSNRVFLSNVLIQLFGHVMSDPFETVDGGEKKRNKYYEKFKRFIIGNCFFNDFKAAKTMFQFGLVDEAFFIAKEKGCVFDLFNFIMENNYNTNWFDIYSDRLIKENFINSDRDFVLSSIGLLDLEIVARNEPKLIKLFAEFICNLFTREKFSTNNVFSFHTNLHLCMVFNPFGSIIDTLFRIYASRNTTDMFVKRESNMCTVFSAGSFDTRDSFNSANSFSETFKICREIGPELLAYCLLVTSKDNQLQNLMDYIYFVQMYAIINSRDDNGDDYTKLGYSRETSEEMNSERKEPLNSLNDIIKWNTNFKQKRHILPIFWTKYIKPKLLCLRDELCISISVLDIDLFDENDDANVLNDLPIIKAKTLLQTIGRKPSVSADMRPNQKCQIKLLGYEKEKSNRVLLLPKSIETGKEIIRQISIGKQHVLILTESGNVYAAGSNECGQLGIDNEIMKASSANRRNQCLSIINPVLINIELKKNETILSIATGDYHSGALVVSTSNKKQESYIFTWGWGVHGQLGHGDIDNQIYPKRIIRSFTYLSNSMKDDNEEFPIEIAMGCYHTVVLTNRGSVYTFGNNHFGQLGILNLEKSTNPVVVPDLPQNITHIDSKYFHTVCCTISCEIFVWGIHPNIWQNSYNHHKSREDISKPEKIDTKNLLNHETIAQISCGTSHTTIVTEHKIVYCFGTNIWGQLGTGNRKELNYLIEVKLPMPIDFISSDDGITVAMNLSEKSTKIFVWGRCSHSLIHEHLKNVMSDTVKPQLLIEYQHVIENNLLWKNCFGIDSVLNGASRIISKQQLMIIFLNFSKYIDRGKFLNLFEGIKEYDIIADYFLMGDSLVQSLFWRIKSIIHRLSKDLTKENTDVIADDIEISFNFYIRLLEIEKYQNFKKPILSMITGFFRNHNISWIIYENIMRPLLINNAIIIAKNFVKFSLESLLSSKFIRDLLLCLTDDNNHDLSINDNISSLELTSKDIERFYELIRAGNADSIYDTADDHKVVFFSGCGHSSVIGKFREHQLKQFVDKLRKKQLNLSSQMIQRLYNDSSIFPDCLDCLSITLKF